VKELQGLTGYIRGGVTALAAKRDFPVYVTRHRAIRSWFRFRRRARIADSDRAADICARQGQITRSRMLSGLRPELFLFQHRVDGYDIT